MIVRIVVRKGLPAFQIVLLGAKFWVQPGSLYKPDIWRWTITSFTTS